MAKKLDTARLQSLANSIVANKPLGAAHDGPLLVGKTYNRVPEAAERANIPGDNSGAAYGIGFGDGERKDPLGTGPDRSAK